MSWEGFWLALAMLIGGPLVLATVVVVSTVCAVCAVPVGVVWGIAAMVRPSILRATLPSWPPSRSMPPPLPRTTEGPR